MFIKLSLVLILAASAAEVLASPVISSTTTAATAKNTAATKTSSVKSTVKTTTTTTTTNKSTSTSTSTAKGTPTPSCIAPKAPASRPKCGASGSGSFSLQLGTCGNKKYDGLFLDPIRNATTNVASVYTNSSATPQYEYLYPPGYGSYGPADWRGFFGAVNTSTITGTPKGLLPIIFDGSYDDNTLIFAITQDLVPVTCGYGGGDISYWYVSTTSGELFGAVSPVKVHGYQQVAPYIVQGCSS